MSHQSPAPLPDSDTRVSRQAWLLLALMTGLNVLNFVDRQLIPSLAPLLMEDLGLSRADIGLLVGYTFVFFYSLMGLLLGVAADRFQRRSLIAAGLTLWSAMTALSGAARSFVHLAIPRVLVGVGEATLTPAALSMLSDVFPVKRLGLATGIYYAGLPAGTALSLAVAGWMAPRYGWRACFYVLGVAGLLAVALLYFVREPVRHSAAGTTVAPHTSLKAILKDLLRALTERPALALVMVGGAALVYASAAALHGITWLVQERGFTFAEATYYSGFMAITSGLLGNLLGGWFADWCERRWRNGRLWSLVLLTLFFAPFSIAYFLLPAKTPLFFACWWVSYASTVAYFGPLFSVIQQLAPPQIRSSSVALGLLVTNLFGVGPGPWITGIIGDRINLTTGFLVSVGVALGGAVLFAVTARVTRPVQSPAARTP